MKRIFKIILLTIIALPAIACAEQPVLMTATAEMLKRGIAVAIDGEPGFIRANKDASTGEVLVLPLLGTDREVSVTVVEPERENETIVVLPVLIEDKSLARGVTLQLITPEGNPASINIPPKRVFLSIPFTIPVTENIHPDFAGRNRNLIIQVVPKITKKAQVDIENTSTDGLVTNIRYEGMAYMKFKDTLNRTNRRDMDGTFFIGQKRDYQWSLITENLFEKFDARAIGVMKNHRLHKNLESRWRMDNVHDMHRSRFGLNMEYKKDKTYAKIGNIDRVVKGRVHSELGYGSERLSFVTRYEGLEVVNPSTPSALAMNVDRFGYQCRFQGGNERSYYQGRLGNLKVQDFNDEGEIDDYFNFDVSVSTLIGGRGKRGRSWSGSKLMFSGETTLNFWGEGSSSWLEGSVDLNIGYKNEYLVYVRFNDDFARITGKKKAPLWESLFISFMRNRNYFNPRDPLARFGLDSIFLDLDYSREGKDTSYARRSRFGVSKFMRVWKYDLPVELYIEKGKSKVYRPGLTISIRRYL